MGWEKKKPEKAASGSSMGFILKTGDKQQAGGAPGQTTLSLTDGETEVGGGGPAGPLRAAGQVSGRRWGGVGSQSLLGALSLLPGAGRPRPAGGAVSHLEPRTPFVPVVHASSCR